MTTEPGFSTDALDEGMLERWRQGETLTTLNLRAALHAAMRAGDGSAERALADEVALREARGDTG